MSKILGTYRLLQDLPDLNKGAIFEHREYDRHYPDRGNIGSGCLILGWINGMCQQGWCGETYIFPGQLIRSKEWFELIKTNSSKEKKDILATIEELKKRVAKL